MPSRRPFDGDRAVLDRRSTLQLIGGTAVAGAFATGAAGENSTGGTYAVEQGDTCIPLVPLSGDETVEELYGLHMPPRWGGDNGAVDGGAADPEEVSYYESTGTTDLQRRNTTITFLYDGPDGLSLVTVHDAAAGERGGAVTWTIENVPTDAEWRVRDDLYVDPDTGEPGDRNYDDWTSDGTTRVVDWTWGSAGTDGGALGPLGEEFALSVDPAFNEAAALWGEHYAADPITDWQVLSFPDGRDSPERTSLALDERTTIRSGGCGGGEGSDGGGGDATAGDPLEVGMVIKPGSAPPPINPRSEGYVPVVLLATDEVDPSSVDVASLRFGPPRVVDDGGGARSAHGGHTGTIGDAPALIVHFPTDEAGFADGDDTAKLVGRTEDGTKLAGTDGITIVGPGKESDDEEDDEAKEDDEEIENDNDGNDDGESGDDHDSESRDEDGGDDDESGDEGDEREGQPDGDEREEANEDTDDREEEGADEDDRGHGRGKGRDDERGHGDEHESGDDEGGGGHSNGHGNGHDDHGGKGNGH